ncbi:MAG: adenylate/guanylate cyclase domain-containing protein [Spirochaetia bacterium]
MKVLSVFHFFKSIRTSHVLHLGELAYSILLLAWFFVPLFEHARGGLAPPLLPLSFLTADRGGLFKFLLVTCITYPIPLLCVFKILAVFFERRTPSLADPTRLVPIVFNVITSGLAVATLTIQLVTFASGPAYFRTLSWLPYAVFISSIAWNAFSLSFLIVTVNRRNPAFQEHIAYRAREGGRARGIQKRIGTMMLPFVLAITVIPALIMLKDFCRTALASALGDGSALADRAALIVRAAAGAPGPLADYMAAEAKRNKESDLPFVAISYVERDLRTGQFEVAASTDRSRIGNKALLKSSLLAAASYRLVQEKDAYEFISPVSLPGFSTGYVSVEVARDVVNEPYFRTEVKILLVVALAVYAAIFLAQLLGRSIVSPILSLCVSVSEVSRALSEMIKGRSRVDRGMLKYTDRVRTNDELKMLSGEIGAMTQVIRGVIPYVSTSTLTHTVYEKPRTQRKNLAFLFTDIRDFTSLCEGHSAEQVVEMLNRYLDLQVGIISENGGDVDKFLGDAIMAVFQGPNKELAACRAGAQIRDAMRVETQRAELARRQALSVGIGVHSGSVISGSVGARGRMDVTSIGDTVNLAARLEGANKNYGTDSLISAVVYDQVKDHYLCREIDLLTVKGKRQPVRIFELLEERGKASDRVHEIQRVFEDGLALYRRQAWTAAEKCFSFMSEKFSDKPSEVFLRRIEACRKTPPPARWDGVFNLSVK